ncbi:MAG: tol-pal system YbgF family protein, partial [Bradymonadaceae bacterium]
MMLSRLLPLAPWLAAVLVVAPFPATGQDVPPEKVEIFEKHVAAGADLYKKQKYHEALEEFRRARQIVDHPKLSYKIGRTLEQLNRCAKARSAYRRYLDYQDLADADRQKAQKRLEGLEDCQPLGHLELQCIPEDARVTIGRQTFDCPVSVDLEAGTYRA